MSTSEWIAFVLGLIAGGVGLMIWVYWVLTKGIRR